MNKLTNFIVILILIIGIAITGYLYTNPDTINWSEVFNQENSPEGEVPAESPNINAPTDEFTHMYKTTVVKFVPDISSYNGFEHCPENSGCTIYGVKKSFFDLEPKLGESYAVNFNEFSKCEDLDDQHYCRLLGYFKYKKEL